MADKVTQLVYLENEKKRLEEVIDCYMAIDLSEMADMATQHLRAVEEKIKEIEEA